MNSIVYNCQNIGIKELLRFFNPTDDLIIKDLVDAWHPADGHVDEFYFYNIETVEQFLNIDYNFKGLVIFYAQVNGLTIEYDSESDQFKLTGNEQTINRIVNQLEISK